MKTRSTRVERAFTPREGRLGPRAANRQASTARAAKYRAEGLNYRGERYTRYSAWKAAHTLALHQHDNARAHVLETHYPKYARTLATEQAPLAQAAQHTRARTGSRQRNALHLARRREYRRDDILSGDYPLTTYRQFVYHYRAAVRSHDAEVIRYLGHHYNGWVRKLSASDARIVAARKEARRVYKNIYDRQKRQERKS